MATMERGGNGQNRQHTGASRIKAALLALIQMPRMKSSSSQCCLCSIGVFMFLGGIIMIATGVSLILNYGIIDDDILLPELRNDEGKRIVGIILICVGIVFALVSVSVSIYYLIIIPNKPDNNVKPDDIKSISTSSSRSTKRPGSNQSARSATVNGQGARRKVSPGEIQAKPDPKPSGNQFSQSMPNLPHITKHKHKSKKKKRLVTKTQLEDIKEHDTVSRKTILEMEYAEAEDTPRSQSEIDNNSLNASETSNNKVPVFLVSDHSHDHSENKQDIHIHEHNYYSDPDEQSSSSNKQTKSHTYGSYDNQAFDGYELASTDSESTASKTILYDLKDEKVETSSL